MKKNENEVLDADQSAEIIERVEFGELVGMIESARERVWRTVNAELVGLYWEIGKWLSAKCAKAEWGDRIVDSAAEYLRSQRPDLGAYTRRTLYRMKSFMRRIETMNL